MNDQYWSWLLTVVGLTGFILAANKVWWCWYINVACQALWFAYAIATEQDGFIVASIIYAIVFTRNAVKWTKEHRRIDALIQHPGPPIGRTTAVTEDERGLYAKGYIDADVAATLKMHQAPIWGDRDKETIKMTMDLLAKRIHEGTASATEISHFLRLGGQSGFPPIRE